MKTIIQLNKLSKKDYKYAGGKATSLAILLKNNFNIPSGFVITTTAFDEFLSYNHLRAKINLELSRKSFEQMRWEELWDTSLRIKNMIIKGKVPPGLKKQVKEIIITKQSTPWAVRSSSIAEDSHASSFAGLHESYINVIGIHNLLEKIKLVWASLYSDGALMYRNELGLHLENMNMAVVIQEFMPGESSGICFSVNPLNYKQAVVEAVFGLNQALVDGDIDPYRWFINRKTGSIMNRKTSMITQKMVTARNGAELIKIKQSEDITPLKDSDVHRVYQICKRSENLFKIPQDMEWTQADKRIFVLQSRPITQQIKKENDQRPWYLSLKRTFTNLENLKKKIESELIPHLIKEAKELDNLDLTILTDKQLADEIEKRKKIVDKWEETYWKEFIPFAHGMRLFGSIYNERIKPEDPYEFMKLLKGQDLEAIKRNKRLKKISNLIDKIDQKTPINHRSKDKLNTEIDTFIEEFPEISIGIFSNEEMRTYIKKLAKQLKNSKKPNEENVSHLIQVFYDSFPNSERKYAVKIFEIGRASYQLRDNDNIYMGRLKHCLEKTMKEGIKRLKNKYQISLVNLNPIDISSLLKNPKHQIKQIKRKNLKKSEGKIKVSQIVGQPASNGIASGLARVIQEKKDLFNVKKGEILVIDAIDPSMTFVIPFCAGIIERRGGMLIHGAIIAREYDIPCITGIADATKIIQTGDYIHIDGDNGIVGIRPKIEK
ncbi:MAG: hypothetical protein KGY67_03960 [Candidatus Thermoplasmatota archaeon]|nr:hypothetical protein [Candidatus Thermoplasmatota archaeon]